jgi:hypothetical protein
VNRQATSSCVEGHGVTEPDSSDCSKPLKGHSRMNAQGSGAGYSTTAAWATRSNSLGNVRGTVFQKLLQSPWTLFHPSISSAAECPCDRTIGWSWESGGKAPRILNTLTQGTTTVTQTAAINPLIHTANTITAPRSQ